MRLALISKSLEQCLLCPLFAKSLTGHEFDFVILITFPLLETRNFSPEEEEHSSSVVFVRQLSILDSNHEAVPNHIILSSNNHGCHQNFTEPRKLSCFVEVAIFKSGVHTIFIKAINKSQFFKF